jgi:hypothetical protein
VSRSRRSSRPPRAARTRGAAPADARWLQDLAAIARDPERRQALDEDGLLLVVFQQCLYFGHTQDPDAAEALGAIYPRLAERVGSAERLELLDRVVSVVEEGGTPVTALLPFLQHEPEPAGVALAAIALASLMPLTAGDEMTGPRALLGMVPHAEDEGTRVGLVAGLLQMGDRRVLPLVREGWRGLSSAGRERLAALVPVSPVAFASTIEFWLEALDDDDAASRAAAASALASIPARAEPQRVLDVRRKFPSNAPDERDEIEILEDVALAEFGARLAGRMRAHLGREDAPAALADALAAWGPGAA